jgi:hypothetical protein
VPTPTTITATLPVPVAVPLRTAGLLGRARAGLLGAPAVSRRRWAVAFTVAALADLAQIVLFPAFIEGAASPLEDALDATVALVLLLTLGYSHRLLFAFALELVPGADLFPTWTAVVASIPSTAEPRAAAAVDRPDPRH